MDRKETRSIALESKKGLITNDVPELRRQIARTAIWHIDVWKDVFKDDPDMLRRFDEDHIQTS